MRNDSYGFCFVLPKAQSDMVHVDDMVYSVGVEKILPKLTLDKYTFIGWTDAGGTMWKSIPNINIS